MHDHRLDTRIYALIDKVHSSILQTGAALCAAILIALLSILLPACTTGGASEGQNVATPSSASSLNAEANGTDEASSSNSAGSKANKADAPLEKPARDELLALLDEKTVDRLIELACVNADDAWIAAHPSAYAVFRPHIQEKSLRLAAEEPLASAYVRGLPERFPAYDGPDYSASALDPSAPSPEVTESIYPHLYQWDLRWGYTMYDGDAFGLSGCGPTAMSMVYQGLTGKNDMSPYDMGQIAFAGGYVAEDYAGTSNGYFSFASEWLGLQCWEIETSTSGLVQALQNGNPVIANMGPGTFSQIGHYIAVTGITNWGKVVVNDPYSVVRSSQLWDPQIVTSEAIMLYAFAAPPQ